MCRNIRPLFNYEPPATDDEIRAAAMQFVKKVSGGTKLSRANEGPVNDAADRVAGIVADLLESLVTSAPAKNRQIEAAKAGARAAAR